MAATFVVETGSGSTTANSYSSIAAADQYHENFGNPTAWSGLSDADKQSKLRAATQYLDARYTMQWNSRSTSQAQALSWPMSGAEDENKFAIASNVIPTKLVEATAILALINVTETLRPDIAAKSQGIKSESKGVGPLKVATSYIGAKPTYKTYSLVHDLLKGFLRSSGELVRA